MLGTLMMMGLTIVTLGPRDQRAGTVPQDWTLVRSVPLAGRAAALGGALGCLALGLAIYRTIRGVAPAPIPAPDLAGREWAFLFVFAATLVFLSSLGPEIGGLGSVSGGESKSTAGDLRVCNCYGGPRAG